MLRSAGFLHLTPPLSARNFLFVMNILLVVAADDKSCLCVEAYYYFEMCPDIYRKMVE